MPRAPGYCYAYMALCFDRVQASRAAHREVNRKQRFRYRLNKPYASRTGHPVRRTERACSWCGRELDEGEAEATSAGRGCSIRGRRQAGPLDCGGNGFEVCRNSAYSFLPELGGSRVRTRQLGPQALARFGPSGVQSSRQASYRDGEGAYLTRLQAGS
jgi:hypothetical protein